MSMRVLLVAAAALCAGGAHAAEHAHERPGHDAGTSPDPQPVQGGLYTAADIQFLQHMIVHHEQALVLCALVPARSARAELQRFARYLDDAQRAEIDAMSGLLKLATDRGVAIPAVHLHGDPPMGGMLSSAQLSAIAAAKEGKDFERLWLEGMIHHHQGAIDMSLEQQAAQFASRNQPYGVDTLVDEMLNVQRGEIGKMQAWLADWGLAPPAG